MKGLTLEVIPIGILAIRWLLVPAVRRQAEGRWPAAASAC